MNKVIPWLVAIFLIGAVASAAAQQPKKVPRIGYLAAGNAAGESARADAIRLALRELPPIFPWNSRRNSSSSSI